MTPASLALAALSALAGAVAAAALMPDLRARAARDVLKAGEKSQDIESS